MTGGVLVEQEIVPGRTRLNELLGRNGTDGAIPEVAAGPMVDGSFVSERRRTDTGWAVSYPPGSAEDARLPVAVALHGKGGSHRSSFGDELGLDRFLALAVSQGVPPFVIAAVDGGDTYWHRRADGTDSGAMVIDELVPLLAARGLDTSRLGLIGWSMGGYGCLHLASGAGAEAVRAVCAVSAALWTSPGDSAPGAFDDADDYAAHDVFARRSAIVERPLRVDCGAGDPFVRANRTFVDGLPVPSDGSFEPGGHDLGYWHRVAPAQLAFLGRHLTPSA